MSSKGQLEKGEECILEREVSGRFGRVIEFAVILSKKRRPFERAVMLGRVHGGVYTRNSRVPQPSGWPPAGVLSLINTIVLSEIKKTKRRHLLIDEQ